MENHLKAIRNILLILLIIVTFAVLKLLGSLILPLILAALLTILNLPVVNFLERRRIPRGLIAGVVALLTLGVLWLVVTVIGSTIEQLVADIDVLAGQFNRKVNLAMGWVAARIPGLNADYLWNEMDTVFSPDSIASLLKTALGTVSSFGSSTVLFLIYYLILLSGATGYSAFIDYVFGEENQGETRHVWEATEQSIAAYMSIKTVISLVTGVLAWLICLAFGLQFALFWGFLAFLLNFIPSIGSILASALPVFMGVIQFDGLGAVVALALCLGASQFVIGSVIDPMVMGNRLRLNTITVIFGLLFWGYIWGIPGMLLSVPLMVMLRLLLERTDDLAVVARIMGNAPKRTPRRESLFARWVSRWEKSGKDANGK
ncbi:MAG: AI-2E family transporter [Spirochaetales bacterium]|nr:AI-2E family transporter [Spirochaetales bacterium]